MGHIDNLYLDQRILLFSKCYAEEKIDGTGATVTYRDGRVEVSAGGAPKAELLASLDLRALAKNFDAAGYPSVTVSGEAYGGKVQNLAHRYGPIVRFCGWAVDCGEGPLSVPDADAFVRRLGLEFVHYALVSTDLAALDAERDAPSVQAQRNGVPGVHRREGVVLLPPRPCLIDGRWVIAKHKHADERETATPREVVDLSLQRVLYDAESIALEWVTPKRMDHVLDHLRVDGQEFTARDTRRVVDEMEADVVREGRHEIVDSDAARKAIRRRAGEMFGKWCKWCKRAQRAEKGSEG